MMNIGKDKINTFYCLSKKNVFKNIYDISQTKSFEEKLILVDENDNKIDSISKINAHLKSKSNKYSHRAFSVFLFDQDNRLLLQKRSMKKITFADLWSNTCCSHPLDTYDEEQLKNNIGIRNAAVRRMKFELGITTQISDFMPFEKIIYKSDSDETFEEFELDHILIAKLSLDLKKLKNIYNTDEVSEIQLVSHETLLKEIINKEIKITPWFKIIVENKINEIFEKVKNLKENVEREEIVNDNVKIINYIKIL